MPFRPVSTYNGYPLWRRWIPFRKGISIPATHIYRFFYSNYVHHTKNTAIHRLLYNDKERKCQIVLLVHRTQEHVRRVKIGASDWPNPAAAFCRRRGGTQKAAGMFVETTYDASRAIPRYLEFLYPLRY